MTKLNEWLLGLTIFFGVYTALVTKSIKHDLLDKYMFFIQLLPLILLVLLGVYAVTTVLYRTLTFNECKEAAKELQEEIAEAKRDLTVKGIKFD